MSIGEKDAHEYFRVIRRNPSLIDKIEFRAHWNKIGEKELTAIQLSKLLENCSHALSHKSEGLDPDVRLGCKEYMEDNFAIWENQWLQIAQNFPDTLTLDEIQDKQTKAGKGSKTKKKTGPYLGPTTIDIVKNLTSISRLGIFYKLSEPFLNDLRKRLEESIDKLTADETAEAFIGYDYIAGASAEDQAILKKLYNQFITVGSRYPCSKKFKDKIVEICKEQSWPLEFGRHGLIDAARTNPGVSKSNNHLTPELKSIFKAVAAKIDATSQWVKSNKKDYGIKFTTEDESVKTICLCADFIENASEKIPDGAVIVHMDTSMAAKIESQNQDTAASMLARALRKAQKMDAGHYKLVRTSDSYEIQPGQDCV